MTNRRKYINHKVTRRDFYYSKYWNRNRECELSSRLIQQRHRRLVRMEIYEYTHSDNSDSQFSDYHYPLQRAACYLEVGTSFHNRDNHPGIFDGFNVDHNENDPTVCSRLSKNTLVLCYMTIITEITSATRHPMHN